MTQRDWRTLGGLVVVGLAVWIAATLVGEGEAADAGPGDAASVDRATVTPAAFAGEDLPLPDAGGAPASLVDANLPGFAPAPAADAFSDTLRFTGRVVDARHEPIEHALVTCWPSEVQRERSGLDSTRIFREGIPWDELVAVRTGADGRFALETRDVPLGRQVLSAAQSYSKLATDSMEARPLLLVEHPAHATLALPVTAERAGDVDVGDIVLAPGTEIVGRLVDARGAPVAGVELGVSVEGMVVEGSKRLRERQAQRCLAISGTSGDFRVTGLAPGSFSLRAEPRDFGPLQQEFEVVAPGTLDVGAIVLDDGARLEGQVVDVQGAPVPGAQIRVRPTLNLDYGPDSGAIHWDLVLRFNDREFQQEVAAGADGRFTVAGLWKEDVRFDVMARAPGLDAGIARNVAPGTGEVRLTLEPEAVWHLRVTDAATGEPLRSASVRGLRHGPGTYGLYGKLTAETTGDGFLLRGASRTRTDAIVSAPGRAPHVFPLPALKAGEHGEQVLSLPAGAVLAGRVTDDDGQPLARLLVRLDPPLEADGALDAQWRITEADGRFRFEALCATSWSLETAAPGCIPMGGPLLIELAAGEVREDLQLVLSRGATIAGLVRDSAGTPIPGAWVRAVTRHPEAIGAALRSGRPPGSPDPPAMPDELWMEACTGRDGRFTFTGVAPAPWMLDAGEGAEAAVPVSGRETVEVELVRPLRPRVEGRVTRAGQPVSGVLVELGFGPDIGNEWISLASTSTNGAGWFALEHAEAEMFYLRATSGDVTCRGVAVNLGWDAVRRVDLALPTGAVFGRVVDAASGSPVGEAQVRLGDPALIAKGKDPFALETLSAPDGTFAFESVEPGTWMIVADHRDWCIARVGDLVVPERGALSDVDVPLARGAVVEVDLGPNPASLQVRLTVTPVGGERAVASSNGKLKGLKTLGRLDAGDYTVRVEQGPKDARVTLLEEQVRVEAGQTIRLQATVGG